MNKSSLCGLPIDRRDSLCKTRSRIGGRSRFRSGLLCRHRHDSEHLKPAVLVTGGAGYIGSHAVLALKDAGWPVAVIDNLTTGFRFAVPDDVPLYEGDIEDAELLARIFAEQKKAIMHFAGSIIVPESVENPLKYYHNNTAKSRALIEAAVDGGRAAFHLFQHRRDLWRSEHLAR